MTSSGFDTTITNASGQCFFRFSPTLRMILRLMLSRSSRDIPGLRGTPAVMMTTSAPAQSAQFEVPVMAASVPSTAPFCSRSSALPLARPSFSGMSNSTTSPSSLRAQSAASSPPMLPAPMRAILFLRGMRGLLVDRVYELQIGDDRVAEGRAGDFLRAVHLAGEIVGDGLLRDGLFERGDDAGGGAGPAEMLEQHDAGQDDRPGVHLVEVGVLGRRAVRRLEYGVAGRVVDVAARRDADAADLGRQRVREVVAVQVERRDDLELVGTGQDLLQRDVGDRVLDQHLAGRRF